MPAKRKPSKSTGPKIDVYQVVTDRVIAALEAGTAPWRKPWNSQVGRPQNIDGRPYRGINILLLGMSGYTSPFWLTFNDAKARGGSVRKGEKGTMVVLWKRLPITETDPATGQQTKKLVFLLRHFTVFNLEQTDGVKLPKRVAQWSPESDKHTHEPVVAAEQILASYLAGGPEFHDNGDAATYSPERDTIIVPPRTAYPNGEEYYSTAFHEIGHSTGHVDRLDRFTGKGRAFGCHDYGREELVAEMTAAFLAAEAGITTTLDNSAAYLASWIRSIKEDPKVVVNAAAAAQRAADLVLGRTFEDTTTETTTETVATGNETLERAA